MKSFILKVLDVFFHLIPMDRKMFFFSSFNGLYNDNPKYISEKLHSLSPDSIIVWIIDKRANTNDIPDYIIKVSPKTVRCCYYSNKAKVVIDNGAGLRSVFSSTKKFKLKFLKKNGQINYSTWHGTPFKKIGADVFYNKGKELYTTSTCFILNSKWIESIFRQSFSEKIPIKLFGSPRNDILFKLDSGLKTLLKQKMSLPQNKRIVIYAPTFRAVHDETKNAYSIYIEKENVHRCLSALNSRFGGDWIFIYRAHQFISSSVNNIFDNEIIFNGNLHDDMAEYLAISDVLITDYSSSLFDYMLTGKPCFLFAPDFNEYSSDRGVYMSMESLPYPSANDYDSLIKNIENYNSSIVNISVNKFMKSIGLIDDGNASERLVKEIIKMAKM